MSLDEGKMIVVTHHGPTRSTAAGNFDLLTPSFHSDLEDLILETTPDAWFYGRAQGCCRAIVVKTDIRCVLIGYRHARTGQIGLSCGTGSSLSLVLNFAGSGGLLTFAARRTNDRAATDLPK